MKKIFTSILLYHVLLIWCLSIGFAQNAPVIIEVETASVGADFSVEEEGGVGYASITSNGTAGNPESPDRIITMEVTFPAAQAYDLYIRCRVGPQGADDDSFFYGNNFGALPISSDNDWIRANNLFSVGYVVSNAIVDGTGGAGTQVWKWINLSEYTNDEAPVVFELGAGNLTQTFQIGAREDGLDIDKIAFARADYFFTVSNLDNGEEGSPDNTGGPTMPPIAEGQPKFLGNVYSASQLPGFLNYWNQVTPENAGKWGSVEATRDVMNWAPLDAAYDLAKENDMYFKLHVLVWGNQQPAWMETLSPSEQLEEIEEWFQAVADRYDDIDFIEVVNEPLHDPPNSPGMGGGNYIEALGGEGETGWDWLLEAFRMARTIFPDAELMLNDYNIVNSPGNITEYLEIVDLLKAENLIDQLGVQAHAFSTANASSTLLQNSLNTLATSGLPLFVTELDIDGPTDQIQLAEYQRVFPIFWEHPAVEGITLWGYRPGMWRTEQGAYLIEEDGVTERPALIWLRNYVASTVLDVEDIQPSDHVSIYPNPAMDQEIAIDGVDHPTLVEFYDLKGRIVLRATPVKNVVRWNKILPHGMYVIKIYEEDHAFAKKIMIGQ